MQQKFSDKDLIALLRLNLSQLF